MSSIQIQIRIPLDSPIFAWTQQIKEAGGCMSQSIRNALECQLAQDVNSQYQREYKQNMLEAQFWRAFKKVSGKNRFQQAWPHIAKELGYNLKPLQDFGLKGHVNEYQETDENLD